MEEDGGRAGKPGRRGEAHFFAAYELTEEALYLRELIVRTEDGRYRPIAGARPPSAFRTVLDITLDAGRVTEIKSAWTSTWSSGSMADAAAFGRLCGGKAVKLAETWRSLSGSTYYQLPKRR